MASHSVVGVILAGGEGKRFRPYTDLIPKPMIPVGPDEKPLLEYIILWLARFGVKKTVLLVGYRWRQIKNYFRNGRHWGLEILYSIDTAEYRGTGGALVNAYRQGLLNSETAIIWYGDIIAEVDIDELIKKHRASNAIATVVLANQYKVPVGIAEVDRNGYIKNFVEKPWLQLYVTIGILTLETSVLPEAEKELGRDFDVMGDLVPWFIKRGYKVKAYIHNGPWYDMGSLERYQKLPEELFPRFLNVEQLKECQKSEE